MSNSEIPKAVGTVYEAIEAFEQADRKKIINAVMALFVENHEQISTEQGADINEPGSSISVVDFFHAKAPNTKVEKLAVAARFRESVLGLEEHSKSDFRDLFVEARVNFDAKNFSGDLRNAKNKGLFNKGPENRLSYRGQQFVDALPDRAQAESHLRSASNKKKKKSKKKKARKP